MKTKVGILMGGASSEYEVSLMSGNEVLSHIDTSKYSPQKFLIKKDGTFDFNIDDLKKLDVVFIALHGDSGENGIIQGFLESLNIPYTGPGVLGSALGMDKHLAKSLWKEAGLPVIPHKIVKSVQECMTSPLPFVLKPRSQGSSVGITIVKKENQIKKAFEDASQYECDVMLEPYVKGKELTVGVLGKPIKALPLIEIIPEKEFYDYDAKYISDKTKYIVPAKLPDKMTRKIQDIAVKACEVLKIGGFSRVDFMLQENNTLLMEVNTIPGLTSHSLLPKAAKAKGISFPSLIDLMIKYSLKA